MQAEKNELSPVIDSLSSALDAEQSRIVYYDKLLTDINTESMPLVTEAVNEAREWSMWRSRLLEEGINGLVALLNHGYPERKENLVNAEVIIELESIMTVLSGIKAELNEIPTAELVVGDPETAL